MIKSLLFVSIAPILVVALYIYLRDKYEREPIYSLLKALLSGILITLPVILVEDQLLNFAPAEGEGGRALFNSFVTASLTEEGFKYMAFLLFFWRSRNFNERFDGIVYAVFISLGFAMVENIIYVYRGGYTIGMLRAVTAVPAHAFFGTVMGYHIGNARFIPSKKGQYLFLAIIAPVAWHGTYDFLILSGNQLLLLMLLPVMVYFLVSGLRKMKELSYGSVFRSDSPWSGNRPDDHMKDQ